MSFSRGEDVQMTKRVVSNKFSMQRNYKKLPDVVSEDVDGNVVVLD